MQTQSLKWRLFLTMLCWMLPLLLLIGGVCYWGVHSTVEKFYDKNLYRTSLALADQVTQQGDEIRADLPKIAEELIEFDTDDDVHFRIVYRGENLAKQTQIDSPSKLPEADKHIFYRTQLDNVDSRAVVYNLPITLTDGTAGAVFVFVAETMQKRELAVDEIIIAVLSFVLIAIIGFFVISLFALKRGLLPLKQLDTALAQRADDDLSALDTEHAPDEIKPLVSAFNDKLQRLQTGIGREKRFIQDAAHQLKTPLAGLKMQAELALRASKLDQAKHALLQLRHASENMTHTVNQLLSLARAEPGNEPLLAMVELDIAELIKKSSPLWQLNAQAKSINLSLSLDGDLNLLGNAQMLAELFNNLVDNAVRYTPAGGSVVVNARGSQAGVIVEVKDTGIGLRQADLTAVFERFYRVLDCPEEGSGLGLTIAQEIAHRHGAALQLKSDGLGKGVSATVQFKALNKR